MEHRILQQHLRSWQRINRWDTADKTVGVGLVRMNLLEAFQIPVVFLQVKLLFQYSIVEQMELLTESIPANRIFAVNKLLHFLSETVQRASGPPRHNHSHQFLFYFTTPLETLLQINACYKSSEESLYSCRGLVYHFCHKDLTALGLLNGACRLSLPAHLQGSILLALGHKIPELHKTGGLEHHFLRRGQRVNRRQRLIRNLARLCWNFLIDKKWLRVGFESMINLLLGSFFLLPLRWDLLNHVF